MSQIESKERREIDELLRLLNTLFVMEEFDSPLFKHAVDQVLDHSSSLAGMSQEQLLGTFHSVMKGVKDNAYIYERILEVHFIENIEAEITCRVEEFTNPQLGQLCNIISAHNQVNMPGTELKMHDFFQEAASSIVQNLPMLSKDDFVSIYCAYLSSGFLTENEKLNIIFEKELE